MIQQRPGDPCPEDEGWLTRETSLSLLLVAATAIGLYLCYRLALPLLPALVWAVALTVIAQPLHAWILRRVKYPDLSAALAVLLVLLVIIVPTIFVAAELVQELSANIERLQDEAERARWRAVVAGNPRLAPVLLWVDQNVDVPTELQRGARLIAGGATAWVASGVWFFVQLFITLFILFYLFRDWHAGLRWLRSLLPLSNAETDVAFTRVRDTINATLFGRALVAGIQGALGGLAFGVLGLPAPVMWGVIMAMLAIVPNLGAFVIWAPAALFLVLEGSWGKALALTLWGTLVIGLIDNVLYPIVVGRRLRVHPVPAFISIVGGLFLLGAAGIVLGPVILAVTIGLIEIWRQRTAGGKAAETGVSG